MLSIPVVEHLVDAPFGIVEEPFVPVDGIVNVGIEEATEVSPLQGEDFPIEVGDLSVKSPHAGMDVKEDVEPFGGVDEIAVPAATDEIGNTGCQATNLRDNLGIAFVDNGGDDGSLWTTSGGI